LIQARIDALAPLAAEEREEKKARAINGENAELIALRLKDSENTKNVARLEAENQELRATQQPLKEVIVENPQHAQEVAGLKKQATQSLVITKFLLEHVGLSKDQIALLSVRELHGLDSKAASEVCGALGWRINEVYQFTTSYGLNAWSNIIEKAQCEGPLVRLARAAMALETQTETPIDNLTAAKLATGTLRMPTASEVAARSSLGRLNSSDGI